MLAFCRENDLIAAEIRRLIPPCQSAPNSFHLSASNCFHLFGLLRTIFALLKAVGIVTTILSILAASSTAASDDVKDQNGEEIARFVDDLRVQTMLKGVDMKLQGCMRCWNECLIYEGEQCVKWTRTCQWDFDCK